MLSNISPIIHFHQPPHFDNTQRLHNDLYAQHKFYTIDSHDLEFKLSHSTTWRAFLTPVLLRPLLSPTAPRSFLNNLNPGISISLSNISTLPHVSVIPTTSTFSVLINTCNSSRLLPLYILRTLVYNTLMLLIEQMLLVWASSLNDTLNLAIFVSVVNIFI